MTIADNEFYTAKELGKLYKISDQAIRCWIKDGKLPATHLATNVRILGADWKQFLVDSAKQ